tara:strand:+ start:12677 stop:13054 length:378 start_codon:yes stop_codon:yes gene_type:complete
MKPQPFSIKKRIKSFSYALRGLKVLFKEEHNAKIHACSVIVVIIASLLFQISSIEWLFVIASIGAVISMEAFNSAIENIADFVSPDQHELIKKIKDLAAGAVLSSALAALAIGSLIFLPKIINLI